MENRGKAGQRKFPWRRLRHLGYRPNRKAESAARKRRGCSFPRQRLCKASSGGQPPRSLNNACDIRAARNEMHRVYRKRRPPSLSLKEYQFSSIRCNSIVSHRRNCIHATMARVRNNRISLLQFFEEKDLGNNRESDHPVHTRETHCCAVSERVSASPQVEPHGY